MTYGNEGITHENQSSKGYILLDVLLAVFLFSLGFAALYGLSEGALNETREAASLAAAANLAQSRMEELAAHGWRETINSQACIPGGTVEGSEGAFHWIIRANWDDIPQLLRVNVEVRWFEQGVPVSYQIESLFEVD